MTQANIKIQVLSSPTFRWDKSPGHLWFRLWRLNVNIYWS